MKIKKREEKKKQKKQQKTKKELFSYQYIFLFWWVSNISFLTTCPKSAHPQNTIRIGVSENKFLKKQLCVTKRPLWTQKTQTQKFQLSLFCPFSTLSTTKNTQQCSETPILIVFWQSQKNEIFQKFNPKHRNLKNPTFAPFFEKG